MVHGKADRMILLYGSSRPIDQFAGVPGALRAGGRRVAYERHWGREASWGAHARESMIGRASAVGFADLSFNLHLKPMRIARRLGVPSVLLVDGVTEFSNIYMNDWLGDRYLRPASQDLLIAMGPLQKVVLEAMGNRVIATGLPRLDGFAERVEQARTSGDRTRRACVVVATALSPSVTEAGIERIGLALREVREAGERLGVDVRWRLTGRLCEQMGVPADTRPVAESLAGADALLTTASTIAVEGMLAGVPTCVVHPHPWPCWVPAAWMWRPRPGKDGDRERVNEAMAGSEGVRSLVDDEIQRILGGSDVEIGRGSVGGGSVGGGAGEVIEALLSPDATRLALQRRLLEATSTPGAARRVADAIGSVADGEVGLWQGPRVEPECIARVDLRAAPKVSRRIVSLIVCHDSRTCRALTPSVLLEQEFERGEHGYEFHTLLVAASARNYRRSNLPDGPRGQRTHVCILEPTDGTHDRLDAILRCVRELRPDVVVGDGTGEAKCACALLRHEGVPSIELRLDGNEDARSTARRMAALLEEPVSRPESPDDEGLRLAPDARIRVPDDHLEADAWVRGWLQSCGHQRIAEGAPTDGCDAVLIRAADPRPEPVDVETWRARGLGVGVSPNLCVEPAVLRAQRAVDRLVRDGCQRIAVLGTGPGSPAFAGIIERAGPIVAFVAELAPGDTTHLGLPVVGVDALSGIGADALIIGERDELEGEQSRRALLAWEVAGGKVVSVRDGGSDQIDHAFGEGGHAAPLGAPAADRR